MSAMIRYHDSGLGNVWINLAKLLLGLTFSSVIILENQLGYDPLSEQPALLTQKCTECEKAFGVTTNLEQNTQGLQVLTSDNDTFTLSFVPISADQYTELAIRFSPVARRRTSGTGIWKELPGISGKAEPVALGAKINTGNAVYVQNFKLSAVMGQPTVMAADGDKKAGSGSAVNPELGNRDDVTDQATSTLEKKKEMTSETKYGVEPGEYCLEYHVIFTINKQTIEAQEKGYVHLKYIDAPVERYGDLPIAQFERVSWPKDLMDKDLSVSNDGKVFIKQRNKTSKLEFSENVKITLDIKNKEFVGTNIPSFKETNKEGNYFELQTYYPDKESKAPHVVAVTFVLSRNQAPQPSLIVSSGANIVSIYDKDFFQTAANEGEDYWYCPLIRFIVDPDGLTAAGIGDMSPATISINSSTAREVADNYRVIHGRDGWRLRIVDKDRMGRDDKIILDVGDNWDGHNRIEVHVQNRAIGNDN